MTVDGTNNRTDYDPDGATSTFIYDFRVDVASDMVVYADGVLYVEPFTITGLGNELGGDVIFDVAPVESIEVLTLIREVPLTQQTSYPPLGPFPAGSHEAALDKLTFIAQQQQETISRAAIAGVDSDPGTDYTLPNYAAGEVWLWDETIQSITTKIISISTDTSLTVANIPSLRAVEGTFQGQPVDVLGYDEPGDGGGGPNRLWEEGAGQVDDGASVIVPGGFVGSVSTVGAWVWGKIDQVNVLEFGAIPGATDRLSELQRAINYAAANGFPFVHVPGNSLTYKSSGSLTLDNNVQIKGDGPKASVIEFTSTTSHGIVLPLNLTKSGIDNIKVWASSGSTGDGISYTETTDPTRELIIDNYEIEGFLVGIRLEYSINGRIEQGRLIGQGRDTDNGAGILLGRTTGTESSTYGTYIGKAYISSYETGLFDNNGQATLSNGTIFESNGYAVTANATSIAGPSLTLVQPYFEGNALGAFLGLPLVRVISSLGHCTVISPWAFTGSAAVKDFAEEFSGANTSLLSANGVPGFAAPSLVLSKSADDAPAHMKCYSSNAGNVALLKFFKSHQDTLGNTETVDTESLALIAADGVNSSGGATRTAEISINQEGAAGGTFVKSKIRMRTGTDSATRSDSFVVEKGGDGDISMWVERNSAGVGTLFRVKVGAADSGGVGLRALSIAN